MRSMRTDYLVEKKCWLSLSRLQLRGGMTWCESKSESVHVEAGRVERAMQQLPRVLKRSVSRCHTSCAVPGLDDARGSEPAQA
jgi:hypothetical protein